MYQTNPAAGYSPLNGPTYIPPQYATGTTPSYGVGVFPPSLTTTAPPKNPTALHIVAARTNAATQQLYELTKQVRDAADTAFGPQPEMEKGPYGVGGGSGTLGQVDSELSSLSAAIDGLRDQVNRLSGL